MAPLPLHHLGGQSDSPPREATQRVAIQVDQPRFVVGVDELVAKAGQRVSGIQLVGRAEVRRGSERGDSHSGDGTRPDPVRRCWSTGYVVAPPPAHSYDLPAGLSDPPTPGGRNWRSGRVRHAMTATRRRRRDRSARSRSRASDVVQKLERRIPYYDLLEEDGLDLIQEHADRILAEVGIEVWGDEVTIELFRDAGATVDGPRLRFDPGLVTDIVTRSAPSEFVQHSRDPERSVTIGGKHTVFAPGYGMPFVRDLDRGRRYGTMADLEDLVKINHTLEWTQHSGLVICEPTDVAVNKRHLDMLALHFQHSSKPLLGAITAPERALDSIEMARIVFGADRLDDHCVIMANINVNSPLVYDGAVTEVIRHYAAAGQGMVICPFILGGAMGPVTPAGAVAQAHAEAMVGMALTQLVRPGAPAIYGNFLTTMSLRSGAPTFGTPEAGLAYFAVGQLARRLGVPVRCGGSFTSSKLPDAQAAQESAASLYTAMMAGANFVLHAAGWLEGGLVMDYEKLVLDNDRLGMTHHLLRGMALDDNAFAMGGFHEVGPGSHFLGSAHTLANYETAYYEATFGDSASWEQWSEEGELDARQRANADWKARLANHESPPLPADVDEALTEFVERRKASMDDAWY